MKLLTSDYISNWFILNDKNNPNYNYIVDNIDNTTLQSVDSKLYLNGVAAPIAMSVQGLSHKTSVVGSLIIQKNSNSKFKDVFDLLIEDFTLIRNKLTYPSLYNMSTKNLMSNAEINVNSDSATIALTYLAKYDQIFNINYASAFFKELDNEFLGRVASTYDIRFYNDDISYLIKSGSISISVAYNTVHLMNTNTVEPFYSPQSFEINFDMTLISKIDDYENINTNNSNIYANYPNFDVNLNNLTLVVGQRHLKLGQASLITSSYLKLKGKIVEVDLKFKSFARMEN